LKEQEKLSKSKKSPQKADNPWTEVMKFVDEKRLTTKDISRMMSVMAERKNDKI